MFKISKSFVYLLSLTCVNLALPAESPEAAMQKVAEASGLDAFGTVDSIAYTFNVELPNKSVTRSWQWWPEADKVQMSEGGEASITYKRGGAAADPKIDQKFINDLYWLMFPFVVVWDATVTLERIDAGSYTAGIEASGAIKVIYPEGVGYTPGDVYEVYYDSDYLMTHWVFRKSGNAEPNLVSTWSDYEAFGPLKLSTEHRSYPEGPFRLWFTDVDVVVKP